MTRAEIVEALTAVGRILHARGIEGELYAVGGAAIALALDTRRSRRDIDAVFEPKLAIYEAAAEVAAELELPPGWLNDAVKGFLGGPDPEAAPVLEVPGLTLSRSLAPDAARAQGARAPRRRGRGGRAAAGARARARTGG